MTTSSLHLSLIWNIFLLHLLYIYAHPHILRKCTIVGFFYIHLYDLCLCTLNSTHVIIYYIFTQYLRKKYNRKSNFNCDYVHKINKINHFHFYIILYTFLFVRIFLSVYPYSLHYSVFEKKYLPWSRIHEFRWGLGITLGKLSDLRFLYGFLITMGKGLWFFIRYSSSSFHFCLNCRNCKRLHDLEEIQALRQNCGGDYE